MSNVTPKDVWPNGCPHPPHVRDEILRVARDEVTWDDVERSGFTFAPWYTKVFLAEQRVLTDPPKQEKQETQVEQLRRRVAELETQLRRSIEAVNQALDVIAREYIDAELLVEILDERFVPNLGFDNLTISHDGERGVVFRVTHGEHFKDFPISIPALIDRGTFRSGQGYVKGDVVSFGGQIWIAQVDTAERPGGNDQWRLAVRHGKDLRNGRASP